MTERIYKMIDTNHNSQLDFVEFFSYIFMMIFGKKEQKAKFIFDFICFRGDSAKAPQRMANCPVSKEILDLNFDEGVKLGDEKQLGNKKGSGQLLVSSRSTDNLLQPINDFEQTKVNDSRETNLGQFRPESIKMIALDRGAEGFSLFDLFTFYTIINADKWDNPRDAEEEAKQMALIVYSVLDVDGNKVITFQEFIDFLNKNPSNIDFFNFVSGTKQTALQELKTDKQFLEISISSKKAQKQLRKLGRLIFHPIHLEEHVFKEGVNFSQALHQNGKESANSGVNINGDQHYAKEKAYIKASLIGHSRPSISIMQGEPSLKKFKTIIPDGLSHPDCVFNDEFVDKINVYLHQYKKDRCDCSPGPLRVSSPDRKQNPDGKPSMPISQKTPNRQSLSPDNYFDFIVGQKDATKRQSESRFGDASGVKPPLNGNQLKVPKLDFNSNQIHSTRKSDPRQVSFSPDVSVKQYYPSQHLPFDLADQTKQHIDSKTNPESNPVIRLWSTDKNSNTHPDPVNQKKGEQISALEPMMEDPESQVFLPFSFANNGQDPNVTQGLHRSVKIQDSSIQSLEEFLKAIVTNFHVLAARLQTIEQVVENEKNRSSNQGITPNTLRMSSAKKQGKQSGDSRRNVFFKDRNWSIVTSMLLGMKHSLAFTSQDKYHKVGPFDYKLNNVFGIEAVYQSYFTHCRFTDYAPYVFAGMRRVFNIKQEDYLNSIGLNNFSSAFFDKLYVMLCEQSSGKSGSFFFYSHDNKYLVKTISREECEKFYEILPKYYAYFVNCDTEKRRTLLSRFFGLHRVECLKGNQVMFDVYVLIMNNVFSTPEVIDHKYDLKGSTYQRLTFPEEIAKKAALKDTNFRNARKSNKDFGFCIDELRRKEILDQINLDVKFLADCNIIDYSLMVGVVKDSQGANNFDESQRQSLHRRQAAKDETILVQDLKNGQKYYIGIIDTLTNFGGRKGCESFFKRVFCGSGVSALPPKPYAQRFLRFMESAFI